MFKNKRMRETVLAYKRLFDTADGREVLYDLMRSCHMSSSTMDSTPNETLFNEGARSVVLRILKTRNTSIEQLDEFIAKSEEQIYE